MLPVKKQDTSPDELGSPLSGGFGRVLGSIQGLQQRLGDFSYGEVSIAEAKVKMLVKQLTLLHNSLDSLVQFKLKVTEIDRRLKAIPVENFDQVNQDDLAKHPQLHAILRASKLISLPNLIQAKSPSASVTPGAAEERFSFTIPPQTTTASQDGGAADQTKDWSFDAKETPLSATDVSTTPLNFEFPGETEATAKSAPKSTAKPHVLRAEPAPSRTINKTQPSKPISPAPKADSSTHDSGVYPGPIKAAAKADESRALVPANHPFDQRLIDDVIKNYGDFTTVPNLPATLQSTAKMVGPTATASRPAKSDLNDAAENARKVLNVKKSGDLDRQLKKIIKDYGEYDIYQRKSVVSFRAGGIIAFAVLGLVLALLYLFKPSSAVSTPQTGLTVPPLATERSLSAQDIPNAPPEELGAGAMKATKNAVSTTETKETP